MGHGKDVLTWLRIGDRHIIEALMRDLPRGSLDFAVLPDRNADDGTPEQFRLVRDAIAGLPVPVPVLAGDHDFKPRNLDAFHAVLGAERLPQAVTVQGHRCLSLDVVSAATGGPTRLGDGGDRDRIGAWPEKFIFDTQPGPNRHGRHW